MFYFSRFQSDMTCKANCKLVQSIQIHPTFCIIGHSSSWVLIDRSINWLLSIMVNHCRTWWTTVDRSWLQSTTTVDYAQSWSTTLERGRYRSILRSTDRSTDHRQSWSVMLDSGAAVVGGMFKSTLEQANVLSFSHKNFVFNWYKYCVKVCRQNNIM